MASARSLLLLLAAPLAFGCQMIPTEEITTTGASATDTDTGTGTGTEGETSSASNGEPTQGQAEPDYRCDPADTESCAENEKCTALLQGNLQNLYDCVNDDGDRGPYEACTPAATSGQDKCPPSTLCAADTFEGTTGICALLCVSDNDCGGGLCLENPFNRVPLCADKCDPFAADCPPGLECRQTTDSFACLFPTEVDTGQETAQCLPEGDRGCSQGYVCEAGGLIPDCQSPSGSCCTAVCDTEGPETCPVPATCNPAFTDPAPGYEWVGACYIPS